MTWREIALAVLISIAAMVFTGLVVLVLIARLPQDYFVNPGRRFLIYSGHPLLRILLLALKNLAGIFCIILGIILSVPSVPGQGFLTILIGVILLDFPGKYRVERWMITRRIASKSINWLRAKAGRPPLQLPTDSPSN